MAEDSPSPNSETVSVALVQTAIAADAAHNPDANLARAIDRVAEAAAAGAQIVCLPELFTMAYPCQSEDHRRFALAESIPGPTTEQLGAAAAEHGVVVVGSLFEQRAAGLYHNTAVVLDADGTLAGRYRKMHIPDDPLYYEKFYFTPGDTGFAAVATRFGRLGICVCWDQWFPEAARLTALAGAEILIYPTAIGWHPAEKAEFGSQQHDAWQTMMRSHAIANGLFVAAVNRTGAEGELEFWGGSFLADPTGSVLAAASHDREETLLVECNLAQIDVVRTHWPFLRDRRVDAYGGLTRRWLADE
ncbi:MAG: acyltransferase [Planctomycetota bacterium]|nr:MAG: acyltransferase [Planctomycetota bacterium]